MLQTTLIIIHLVLCVFLVISILMQESKQQGMSAAISGGSSESFFSKNKGKTKEALLAKITTVVAILFIVNSVLLAFFIK